MKKFDMDSVATIDIQLDEIKKEISRNNLYRIYESIVNTEGSLYTLENFIKSDAKTTGTLQIVKTLKTQLQDMKTVVNIPDGCKEAIENYVFIRNREYAEAEQRAEEGMAAYEEMAEKDCDIVKRYYLVERPGDFEPDQFEFSGTENVEEDIKEIFTTGGVTKIIRTDEGWNERQVVYDYYRTVGNGGMKYVLEKMHPVKEIDKVRAGIEALEETLTNVSIRLKNKGDAKSDKDIGAIATLNRVIAYLQKVKNGEIITKADEL